MKGNKDNQIASVVTISTFFILYFCFFFYGCKSPASPEEPPFQRQYRDVVKFTYTRDSSKIIDADHKDMPVPIRYILFDSEGATYTPDEEYMSYGYSFRIADVYMEKIGKYKFQIILKHVLIHEGAEEEGWGDLRHNIFINDKAVLHPIDEKDIKIEGAYDLTANQMTNTRTVVYFKMSKN